MVAPVQEIRNKFTFSSTNMNPTQNFVLPTVYQVNDTGMDILKEQSPDNYNEIRGRLLSHNSSILRDTSMSSTKSSIAYHDRMERNNDMVVNEDIFNNDISPKLSYETTQEKALHLSKVTENQMNTRPMQVSLISNTCLQHSSNNYPNMSSSQGIAVQNKESTFINIFATL